MSAATTVTEAIATIAPEPPPKILKRLRKVAKVSHHADPIQELRRLVQQHANQTRLATRLTLMQTDRKNRTTGEVSKNTLPDDVRADLRESSKRVGHLNKSLESAMTRELKGVPIHDLFLRHVYGVGPVVAAYLCAMVRIDRATKPSNLRRYCGYALDKSGRLERREFASKFDPQGRPTDGAGTFNAALRTVIWQMLTAMRKSSVKVLDAAPFGITTKYLEIWDNSIHRSVSMGVTLGAYKKGLHKAADVFIEDLYIVWRALAGLPVWPSYYAAKLGYEHGGKISVNAPKMLTVEEALALVGNVGRVARTSAWANEAKKGVDADDGDEP